MAQSNVLTMTTSRTRVCLSQHRENASGCQAWLGAIVAGAAAADASHDLLILGTGLGLSSVSPWAQEGMRATTFGVSTILWVTFTQIVASALGGYLAGRLRTKWVAVHTDEVYFRDTAHGFLTWAVATLVTAAVRTTQSRPSSGVVRLGPPWLRRGGCVRGRGWRRDGGPVDMANPSGANSPMGYFVIPCSGGPDGPQPHPRRLPAASRSAPDSTSTPDTASPPEVDSHLHEHHHYGTCPRKTSGTSARLSRSARAWTQQDAEKRVTDTYARAQASKLREAETAARDAADKARKASAYAALWLSSRCWRGIIASLAATYGGRHAIFSRGLTYTLYLRRQQCFITFILPRRSDSHHYLMRCSCIE